MTINQDLFKKYLEKDVLCTYKAYDSFSNSEITKLIRGILTNYDENFVTIKGLKASKTISKQQVLLIEEKGGIKLE